MKGNLRKTICAAVIALAAIGVTGCGGSAPAASGGEAQEQATLDKSSEDIQKFLNETLDKMDKYKSYSIDARTDLKMAFIDLSAEVDADVILSPLKAKAVSKVNIPGQAAKEIDAYTIEKEDGSYFAYTNDGTGWSKPQPMDAKAVKQATMNPMEDVKMFVDNAKGYQDLGTEKLGDKDARVIEVFVDSSLFPNVVSKEMAEALPFSPEDLAKLGDITYKLWITDAGLVKCNMDLTKNFVNLITAIEQDQSADAKAKALMETLKGFTLTVNAEMMTFDTVADFELPAEIK